MIMQLKFKGCGLQRAIGYWAFAILCGSAAAACSGTIETPTEENPREQADDDDAPVTPPRQQANNNNAADDEEEEEQVAPPVDEEEEELPAAEEEEELPANPPAAGSLAFEADVWPIFNGQCGPCHVGQRTVHSIGSDDIETALQDSIDFEDEVIAELESGDMPLGCGGPPGSGGNCVSEEDFETIEAWYAAGAPE
jgi:hypothetical protein